MPQPTTPPRPETLPADAEGELRDLARDLHTLASEFGSIRIYVAADRVDAIIRRYSGIRPLRAGGIIAARDR